MPALSNLDREFATQIWTDQPHASAAAAQYAGGYKIRGNAPRGLWVKAAGTTVRVTIAAMVAPIDDATKAVAVGSGSVTLTSTDASYLKLPDLALGWLFFRLDDDASNGADTTVDAVYFQGEADA